MKTRGILLILTLVATHGGAIGRAQDVDSALPITESTITESDWDVDDSTSYLDAIPLGGGVPGGLYFEAGTVWLDRTEGSNVTVARLADTTSGAIVQSFTTNDDLSSGFEPGLRLLLGYQLRSDTSFEASYTGLNNWFDAFDVVSGMGQTLASPILIPGTGEERYILQSQFHTAEFQIRRIVRTRRQSSCWLGYGFRYTNLQEFFLASSSFGAGGGERSGVSTHNNLLGGQIGAGHLRFCGPLTLAAHCKAALGANLGNYEGIAFIDNNGVTMAQGVRADETTFSALIDWRLGAAMDVHPNLSLRAGYEFLLLTGMALASDQIVNTFPTPTTADLQNDGVVFLHGPTFTAEISWGGPRR